MNSAVIVAGGKGKRMGHDINKQYIKINGMEILAMTIEKFQKASVVDEIILVVPADDIKFCKESIVDKYSFSKVKDIVSGGSERQDSVYRGLMKCSSEASLVAVHDGVRPFVTEEIIIKSYENAEIFGACAVGVPVKNTIKVVDDNGFIKSTPDRKSLYSVQTPQTFKYDLILNAYKAAEDKNITATDDAALVESMGMKVKMIQGSYINIKITTPEDLIYSNAIIEENL